MTMLTGFLLAALAVIAPTGAAQADTPAKSCPGFERDRAAPEDPDRSYIARAVRILQAAAARDEPALAPLVTPGFAFELWRGDVGKTARTPGTAAAIELAAMLKPRSYQAEIEIAGPVAVIPSTTCAWHVTLLVRPEEGGRAARLKFDFVDGKLARVTGSEVLLVEGALK